ncbi:MAG: glycoside hydrolase family 27 protein [Treponema sp.]|nr:glycoside hydrolase family 27 protein [Treponema sp.]
MCAKDQCAPTPPMGWNSWDCYAATVTEEQLLRNAEYMRKNLLPYGWEYIVCDIQWYEPLAGTGEGEYRPFAPLCMDEYSRLIPAENRFPSSAGGKGFAPIAKKIHGMGLRFGIHIMRGIPRQAVHGHTPVKGAGLAADAIANPFSICKWNGDMYGVDAGRKGAQDYYDSLFEMYASWGVDYVKVDDMCNTNMYPHAPYSGKAEIETIRRAIDRCGRAMVLSLSPGPAPIDEAWHLKKHANMWRITDDFWDRWDSLKDMFRRCEIWQSHGGPGSWPDCDMLPLGRIGMGFHRPRQTNFTKDEQRTMMTLWCIFRSPLMLGCELNDNDDWTLSLLANDEVLDVLKRGADSRQIGRDNEQALWMNSAGDGAINLALFNLSDKTRAVRCPVPGPQKMKARDLWNKRDLGTVEKEIAVEIAPHGAALYRLNGS